MSRKFGHSIHLFLHVSYQRQRSAALIVPPPPSPCPATCQPDAIIKRHGASPLFYLARFAMALAPSSLMMIGAGTLSTALFAPVETVHAAAGADEVGTDTDFKVSVREE